MKHKFTSLFITVLVASDIGYGGQYYIFVGVQHTRKRMGI